MAGAQSGAGGNGSTTAAGSAGLGTTHAGTDGLGDGGVAGDDGTNSAGGSKAGTGGVSGAGAGGTGTAGSGVAGFGTTGGSTTANPDLIDDFEDGDKLIKIINSPRRDGIWDTNNDMTAGGVQSPAPAMFLPTELAAMTAVTDDAAPYAGDMYAAHVTGKGFNNYAYMNVSMRAVADYNATPVYDASGYKGISFIAKAGSTASATKAMHVRFISADTDPRGKNAQGMPKCMTTGAQDTLCYNHYYVSVTLTNTWKLYTFNFTNDFVQGASGMVNPTIDTAEMYGLEFYFFTPGAAFDLWVDDLTFTK